MNKWQRAKIEKGLCMACGKRPPREGFKMCEECAAKQRVASAATRAKKRAAHQCMKCGELMAPDWFYCICQKCKDENTRLYLLRVARRRAAGQCPKCGKPMDRAGGQCRACLDRQSEYFKQWVR